MDETDAEEIIAFEKGKWREESDAQRNTRRRLSAVDGYVLAEVEEHEGALPSPEVLQKYNEILPGLAREIVDMAHAVIHSNIEDNNREYALKAREITENAAIIKRAQQYGFCAVVLFLGLCAYIATRDVKVGGLLGAGGIGAVMVAYFTRFNADGQKRT